MTRQCVGAFHDLCLESRELDALSCVLGLLRCCQCRQCALVIAKLQPRLCKPRMSTSAWLQLSSFLEIIDSC
jgi:hypothetical protein